MERSPSAKPLRTTAPLLVTNGQSSPSTPAASAALLETRPVALRGQLPQRGDVGGRDTRKPTGVGQFGVITEQQRSVEIQRDQAAPAGHPRVRLLACCWCHWHGEGQFPRTVRGPKKQWTSDAGIIGIIGDLPDHCIDWYVLSFPAHNLQARRTYRAPASRPTRLRHPGCLRRCYHPA